MVFLIEAIIALAIIAFFISMISKIFLILIEGARSILKLIQKHWDSLLVGLITIGIACFIYLNWRTVIKILSILFMLLAIIGIVFFVFKNTKTMKNKFINWAKRFQNDFTGKLMIENKNTFKEAEEIEKDSTDELLLMKEELSSIIHNIRKQ